jgi:hypothetical protein
MQSSRKCLKRPLIPPGGALAMSRARNPTPTGLATVTSTNAEFMTSFPSYFSPIPWLFLSPFSSQSVGESSSALSAIKNPSKRVSVQNPSTASSAQPPTHPSCPSVLLISDHPPTTLLCPHHHPYPPLPVPQPSSRLAQPAANPTSAHCAPGPVLSLPSFSLSFPSSPTIPLYNPRTVKS